MVLMTVLIGSLTGLASLQAQAPDPALSNSSSRQEIGALIEQLGGDHYIGREQAERALSRAGMPAVRPLVDQIVNGSPETAMRSVRILGHIGIAATETDMTRVTRILQLLANNGYSHLGFIAAQMADRWKQNQTERVLQQIRECGVQFTSADQTPAVFLERPGLIEIVDEIPAPVSAAVEVPLTPAGNVMAGSELIAKVDQILVASAEEVQAELAEAIADSGSAGQWSPPANGMPVHGVIDGRWVDFSEFQHGYFLATITEETTDISRALRLMTLLPVAPQLEFSETEIDEEDMQALEQLPGLSAVTLTRCRYDAPRMLQFIKDHPAINVTASGHDAFLGVSLQSVQDFQDYAVDEAGNQVETGQMICRVLTVVEGTAAADAGIQEGDAILEIDDYPISTFSELVVVIASRAPGDEMKLKIMHGEDIREETVTLRERPPGQ